MPTAPVTALTPAQARLRLALTHVFLLLLFGLVLLYSNRLFTFIDDETLILGPAAQPNSVFFSSFGALLRTHEHPPLYDLLLHVWIRLTGGAMPLLRVPSVIFFIAGLFCLTRAAQLLAGTQASTAMLWLGVLWPYGFHFGRLAAWYPFVFLLIAALTWAYLHHAACLADQRSPAERRSAWMRVCLLGLALVYANYLGWALLFLLAVDDWLRHRARPDTLKRLSITVGIFLIAYAPLWPAFWRELGAGTSIHQSWTFRLANTAYNVYVLFVSESVAPWFWWMGIPAAVAVAACLFLALFGLRGPARRFLLFAAILVIAMAAIGILYPRRLFMVAPWFLLAISAAIGVIENRYWRIAMALSLGLVAAIGWYGFSARRFYAAPRFFEPWQTVAQDAAEVVHNGGTVIGNNPSFFFYLTYALQAPESPSGWRFSGILTESVKHPQVWEAGDWEEAGRPVQPNVLWVRGMPGPEEGTLIASAGKWLDGHCGGRTVRYLARDPSYQAKQKFAPEMNQLLWRIEVHDYDCQAPAVTIDVPSSVPARPPAPAPTPAPAPPPAPSPAPAPAR